MLPHPRRKRGELLCRQCDGTALKQLGVFWPFGCSVVLWDYCSLLIDFVGQSTLEAQDGAVVGVV